MATLQSRFHYPYIPDKKIDPEKGQIIAQEKPYKPLEMHVLPVLP